MDVASSSAAPEDRTLVRTMLGVVSFAPTAKEVETLAAALPSLRASVNALNALATVLDDPPAVIFTCQVRRSDA